LATEGGGTLSVIADADRRPAGQHGAWTAPHHGCHRSDEAAAAEAADKSLGD